MRSMIFTLVVLLGLVTSSALSQNWTLARHGGGGNDDYGDRVAVDSDDNTYVVGEFSGTATFDTVSLTGPGRWNVYLAKYNREGRIVRATTVAYTTAPTSDIYANAIAVDRSGHLYIAGRFVTDATFSGTARTSLGSSDMFLAKLDTAGSLLWVRTPGGVGVGTFGQDGIASIGLDSSGNCYVAGHYNSDAQFDTIALSSQLTFEAFVAKYDSAGRVLWARSGGGIGAMHIGLGLAVDRAGNSYITGKFFNTLSFGPFSFDAGDAEQKAFIAKADPDGNFLWAKEVGNGGYYGAGEDVAVDRDGNAYVVGQFRSTIGFGSTVHTYNNGLRYAALVVKYDRDGNYLWSKQSGGADQAVNTSKACVDAQGNVYAIGSFTGTIEFGSTSLINAGTDRHTFVVSYDSQGRPVLAQALSGTRTVAGSCIVATPTGECVVTGSFSDSMRIGSRLLQSSGGFDMFLARLAPAESEVVERLDDSPPSDLFLYPNPASDIVRLKAAGPHGAIRVLSIAGIQVMETEYADRIDIGSLPAGLYLVEIGGRAAPLIKTGEKR